MKKSKLVVSCVLFLTIGWTLRDFQSTTATAASSDARATKSAPVVPGANIFVGLAKKVVPSVVNISTLTTVKRSFGGQSPDELFRQFFDMFRRNGGGGNPREQDEDGGGGAPQPGRPLPKSMALGTGFIIDAEGLILTNNHVVADADEIKISFTEALDEKPTDGTVVGRDPELDLALIQVKTKRKLEPIAFGDSDALEVGEYVIAVGNPFGQGHSVSHGIISAKERLAPDFALAQYLQTDAPINPGNSGGPLVNLNGEVVGINNAIDARAQGIGFAIPINFVKKVLPQLKSKGTVTRGYLGVSVEELTPELAKEFKAPKETRAPFVSHVYPGQPADKAGIKTYDILLEVNGKKVNSAQELIRIVTDVPVGEKATVKILRAGEEKTISVSVTERPSAKEFAQRKTDRNDEKKGKKKDRLKPSIDLGMTIEELTPEIIEELGISAKTEGVVVSSLSYDGPADRAGLRRGDVIIEVDRKPVKTPEQVVEILKDKKSYLLRVLRPTPQGGGYQVVVLNLAEK